MRKTAEQIADDVLRKVALDPAPVRSRAGAAFSELNAQKMPPRPPRPAAPVPAPQPKPSSAAKGFGEMEAGVAKAKRLGHGSNVIYTNK